jgi:hypothetical protein
MNKLITIALLLATSAANASNWVAGIGYTEINSSGEGLEIKLPGTVFSLGHKFTQEHSNFSIIPEFSLITGSGQDTIETNVEVGRMNYAVDINIEIEEIKTFSVRGQYEVSGSYMFAGPICSRTELNVSALDIEMTAHDSDWGYLIGGGIDISGGMSFELSFNRIGNIDALAAQLRINF